ncbi:MAG: ethanolamine ammonia-lyase reactivating factor EutA [Anaerolineaceae bacterium]|nr:ethanolamine ammonia-lyase reactivating factor EutA [Anaerolineaceae bacterium]
MTDSRDMVSVGIDIGTTTTQIIFSKLTLVDVSRAGQIPRIDITARKILYKSDIVFTPLLDEETIDAHRLADILNREYGNAGINPSQIETGAVIITGETAKKKNADEILKVISGLAGDFVVTVAGPHVESMIAGRGSGAAEYSRQHFTTVTNVDIGGGSANSAIFQQGNMVAASAMNFGGRIMEIDHVSGKIRHLTLPARLILEHLGLHYNTGESPYLEDLRKITECMADLTFKLIEGTTSPLAQKLYLTPPSPVSGKGKALMFSGGIGHYFYDPIPVRTLSDITIHDDIGPLLAQSLREQPLVEAYTCIRPSETLRATVLGASSQMVTLSGSTIWIEEGTLPLKNIPVVRTALNNHMLVSGAMTQAIQAALTRWDIDPTSDFFAIALELDEQMDYPVLVQVANGLIDFAKKIASNRPLIVIIRHDYAQVLGQTIKALAKELRVLVIDQVGLTEGDFIDIGSPLMDGRVVPLSVKTLIFYHDAPV